MHACLPNFLACKAAQQLQLCKIYEQAFLSSLLEGNIEQCKPAVYDRSEHSAKVKRVKASDGA